MALCPTTCFKLYHTKADPVRYLPASKNLIIPQLLI